MNYKKLYNIKLIIQACIFIKNYLGNQLHNKNTWYMHSIEWLRATDLNDSIRVCVCVWSLLSRRGSFSRAECYWVLCEFRTEITFTI